MSSGIIVAVKTKPYLKDYIIFKYGGQEPVKATIPNKLFPMLSRYLTKKPVGWRIPVATEDTILFELPFTDSKFLDIRSHCYINPKHFKDISSFFYGLFYSEYTIYMNKHCIDKERGILWQFKYGIINFMDSNNICFDKINYDSIKRIYQRYRHQFDDYDEKAFDERNKRKKLPTSQHKKHEFEYI